MDEIKPTGELDPMNEATPATEPEPTGEPQPMPRDSVWPALGSAGLLAAIGGAAFFLVMSGVARPTMGSTRSTHLKWEQQQQQVDAAARSEAEAAIGQAGPRDAGAHEASEG